MTRLPIIPRLTIPPQDASNFERQLHVDLNNIIREISAQLNGISEGVMANKTNALTSAPTTVILAVGDIIPKVNPSETGTVASKYVLMGWQAVVDGTASTASIVELRVPTGN